MPLDEKTSPSASRTADVGSRHCFLVLPDHLSHVDGFCSFTFPAVSVAPDSCLAMGRQKGTVELILDKSQVLTAMSEMKALIPDTVKGCVKAAPGKVFNEFATYSILSQICCSYSLRIFIPAASSHMLTPTMRCLQLQLAQAADCPKSAFHSIRGR